MRLGTWLQHVDLRENAGFTEQWLYGNRSILGGLVGAWLGVHVAKRATGYRLRTGDLFAPAVALGMAVGRVGCLLTEQPGTPTGRGWGIALDAAAAARTGSPAGVPLHPSFVYEIVFHLLAFAALWGWLRHRHLPPGETFVWYVAAYGVFRFLVEFVRGNDVAWMGLTRPQLFLLVTVPLVLARIAWQVRRGAYRGAMSPTVEPVSA
jgi:prolipoprotein diacylglyceryltransferase